MTRDHVVQVRLDDDEHDELQRVATGLGLSKSEVLRRGITAARQGLDRLDARRKNIHLLVKMAEEIPGPDDDSWKARF